MLVLRRALAITAMLPAAFAGADAAAPLAGHWEGAIHTPLEEMAVTVDLAAGEGVSGPGGAGHRGQYSRRRDARAAGRTARRAVVRRSA